MKNLNYTPFLTKQELKLPFYAATIGNPKFQPKVFRPDGISHYQILYTVSGGGRCVIDGETAELTEGHIMLLPPNTRHEYSPIGEEWETMFVTFGGSGFNEFFNHRSAIVNIENIMDFQEWYRLLYSLKDNNRYGELSVSLYKLLVLLNDVFGESAISNLKNRDKIETAIKIMNEDFDFTVADVAQRLDMSAEHLCRIFKEYMGYRPVEYMNMLKLQKAKELLNNRCLSIFEVSKAVGFNDHSYFGKLFKREFGVTPSEYRN